MIWAMTMLENDPELGSGPLEVAGGEPCDWEGEALESRGLTEGAPEEATDAALPEVAVRERVEKPGGGLLEEGWGGEKGEALVEMEELRVGFRLRIEEGPAVAAFGAGDQGLRGLCEVDVRVLCVVEPVEVEMGVRPRLEEE